MTGLPQGSGELLSGETLSPEEEARILARTLAKAGLAAPGKGERTMKRSRFGLMLLAGVLCAGAVVASAAGYFTMKRPLAEHLGAGEKEAALVSQAGNDLGESCTAQGWTITASQVLGDKTQMRVLLDVTAPEGTVLGKGHYRLELPMLDPSVTFTIDDVDENTTDNKLSFVLSTIKPKDYRGRTVKLHFGGVSRYRQYTVEELNAGASPLDVDKLVTADFDLSFKLDYQDTSVTRRPGAEIDTPNGKIRVDEVTVSPLSIFVKISGEGAKPGALDSQLTAVREGSAAQDGWDEKTYTVTDGGSVPESLEVLDKNGDPILWRTGDTEPDSFTLTFGGIVDPKEVSAIVVYGVKVPLAG